MKTAAFIASIFLVCLIGGCAHLPFSGGGHSGHLPGQQDAGTVALSLAEVLGVVIMVLSVVMGVMSITNGTGKYLQAGGMLLVGLAVFGLAEFVKDHQKLVEWGAAAAALAVLGWVGYQVYLHRQATTTKSTAIADLQTAMKAVPAAAEQIADQLNINSPAAKIVSPAPAPPSTSAKASASVPLST